MFVVVKKSKTSKRELVYIVESYRDENQKIRQRIVRKCGELSELLEKDPDAIEKLKMEVKNMTSEGTSKGIELSINLNLPNNRTSPLVNYGYFFVESLYRSLKIASFLDKHFDDTETVKQINADLRTLIIREYFNPMATRGLPGENEPHYFGNEMSSPAAMDSIEKLQPLAPELMRHVYKMANKGYKCTDKVASLDITSYVFNSTGKHTNRTRRTDETAMSELILVQMGLLYDRYRNPAACVVFPDGTLDNDTLVSVVEELKKHYGLDRIVITSDRGFGSNTTLAALHESGNGYVVGRKVKNTPVELQQMILDESGYKWNEAGTFKFKSFVKDRIVDNIAIPEKIISMWTSHNAAKMKQRRDQIIIDFLANPQNYQMGAYPEMDKYVIVHDTPETPEESAVDQSFFSFDVDSYTRDMALDGYYALITTEMDVPESVIIKRYHNLQKIGKAFAAPEDDEQGGPNKLWTQSTVNSYFLVSFITLAIERKLERMLGYSYTPDQLKQALLEATCKNIGQDIYDFGLQSQTFVDIEQAFDVRFDKAYATLEMIRKYRKDVLNGC